MDAQAEAETNTYNLPTMPDSDDSEEENSQEEQPATSWNELSIIDRVGLNSVEMSEKDLETAFSQIALAFRCDQYTLKQRLQAEEHARNLAEENIQLELTRGRETLEALKDLCLDITRSKILQRLELSLDILGGTVERISNTAEVLGAVHQEARVSRAVELMVAHVENLRRRQDRNVAEMEDSKNHRASPEPEDGDSKMKSHQHPCCRRRVSVSLIQIPEKTKRELTKLAGGSSKKPSLTCPSPTLSSESSCVAVTKDNSCTAEDRPLVPDEEASAAQLPAEPTPTPTPAPDPECPPSKQVATRKIQNKNSPLDTLRQRHKSKAALSKKKAEKDKKTINIHRQLSVGSCGATWRHRPLTRWLYRCRWALLCMYIFVLLSVLTLTYLLWNVHEGTFEP